LFVSAEMISRQANIIIVFLIVYLSVRGWI
jgi:hypothetical protein